MGADLYIEKVFRPQNEAHKAQFDMAVTARDLAMARAGKSRGHSDIPPAPTEDRRQAWAEKAEEYQKIVDQEYDAMYAQGYFRDSYNASSVLWQMGLSWWADVIPMLNKRGNLSGAKLREFRQMLVDRPIKVTLKDLRKNLKEHGAALDKEENSPRAWRDHFIKKREELIAFVDEAIKLRTCIRCSL